MDIDIINDILTLTVNKCILGQNIDLPRTVMRPEPLNRMSSNSSDHGSRLSQSSLVSRKEDSFTIEGNSHNTSLETAFHARQSQSSKLLQNCTIADWLKHNAPILMHQSLTKLGLELDTIEKLPLHTLTLEQLAEKKKRAKNELKHYDTKFEQDYKRLPNREEKEPMRPLYIYYKLLKQAMDTVEHQPKQHKESKSATEAMLEELVELKNQRNELRTKLEAYQYDFIRRNNRRIKYRADIREVEADYNLYKKLKDDIKSLEDGIRERMNG